MKSSDFRYIDGSLVFPQPFFEGKTQMFNFVFSSDLPTLQKVCDAWFNEPTDGAVYYEPFMPFVILTFSNNGKAHSVVPPFDQWGGADYKEVIFSIPVVRIKKAGPVRIAEYVGTLVPFIFVDIPIPLVPGREIYGLPKSVGWIDTPGSTNPAGLKCSLEAVSTPAFGPDVQYARKTIAAIQQTGAHSEPHVWSDMETAFKAIGQLVFGGERITLPGISLAVEIAEIFARHQQPFTSLRQLRAIDSSSAAAYQSVVDYTATMTRFHGAGLLNGTYTLQMPPDALYPVGQTLGLRDGQQADAAFWLDWEFTFDKGKDVWTRRPKPSFWQWLKEGTGLLMGNG